MENKEEFIIKIKLAFEYSVAFLESARDLKVEITPELVGKMEDMMEQEFPEKTAEKLALQMIPNILAIFETNSNGPQE
ncbi:MAG: hypothetical protein V4509_00665 [Patescibacteria group bacterium]